MILFLILISPFLLILLSGFLIGFNGYKRENGFSDFVNSARWTDSK